MLAEVAELVVNQCGGRGRDEHLPAVPCSGDSGRPVDIRSDVALVRQERRAGVEPHPNWNRQRGLRVSRRFERARRGREGDEESIALRVDLDAAVPLESLAQDAPVLSKFIGVALCPELGQQSGRTLDVREEKGDGAGRKLAHFFWASCNAGNDVL